MNPNFFGYKNNQYAVDGIALSELAAKVPTPFYCYSVDALLDHYTSFQTALDNAGLNAKLYYSVKSNSHPILVNALANAGAGADCVSAGEVKLAIDAGVNASDIIFAGVGKTKDEMRYALEQGIFQFNVESEPELLALNHVATELGIKAPVALRVNPDVDAKSHDKITTGRKEDKFGIEWLEADRLYDVAGTLDHINVQAVAVHIGSQLTELEPFELAFKKVSNLVVRLRSAGHTISHLDLGGGIGINYDDETPPAFDQYAQVVKQTVGHLGCSLAFEPGRSISGNAGILVSKVIYLKKTTSRNFLIIDAAMNDLIRPSLYDAYHHILPATQTTNTPRLIMDVVGPVCESGDVHGKQRTLPELAEDELVVIESCGAYGAVMASTYNARSLPAEVVIKGGKVISE